MTPREGGRQVSCSCKRIVDIETSCIRAHRIALFARSTRADCMAGHADKKDGREWKWSAECDNAQRGSVRGGERRSELMRPICSERGALHDHITADLFERPATVIKFILLISFTNMPTINGRLSPLSGFLFSRFFCSARTCRWRGRLSPDAATNRCNSGSGDGEPPETGDNRRAIILRLKLIY